MFAHSVFILGLLALGPAISHCQGVSLTPEDGSVVLADEQTIPNIFVASNESYAVFRAANDLAVDFGRVVGTNGTVIRNDTLTSVNNGSLIIIGTLGTSGLIDGLVEDGKLDTAEVQGQWEAYVQQIVFDPIEDVSEALVIAGSDRRGTIFGIYDVSESMGVSPWYWWADVPVRPANTIYAAPDAKIQGPPSVKYRGIFINDEVVCLTGWAKDRFNKSDYGSPFTGDFYKLVFELLLRLKANYLWPAMKASMFYVDDTTNGELADSYGIVMGTSHTEPMARATDEQERFLSGAWDWGDNSENITEFMRVGVNRSSDWETLYTVGMRGEGDTESPTLTASQLEQIIQTQQEILQDGRKTSVEQTPQAWALYKEVGKYYQAGMNVPDDITLLWSDDNFGNLLRTPYPNETDRAGGAGVYYHLSYVGRPRIWDWINEVQLIKTWEQMHLAYEKQARQVWVVNVGDIKPMEIPMSHFLDMAYDMSKHQKPTSTTAWLKDWAGRQFGSAVAESTAAIVNQYGVLAMRRKYQALNMPPFIYSTLNYDEATRALDEWNALLTTTQAIYESLNEQTQWAFYQMVLHPVLAGKVVSELFIKTELGKAYRIQHRTSTNVLASEARAAFSRDAEISEQYNSMNGSKWNHIMEEIHIGFVTWYASGKQNILPTLSYVDDSTVPESGIMGISVEGSNLTSPGGPDLFLLPVDPFMPPNYARWLDVYTRDNGTLAYQITSNVSYVSISNSSGKLSAPGNSSDVRCHITVDWDSAPTGVSWAALHVTQTDADGIETIAYLPVNKTAVAEGFTGYVESNGVISIEAAHFSDAETQNGSFYVELPFYGRTLSGVKIWPVTIPSQTTETAPKLLYDFYTFSSNVAASVVVYLGGSRNHDETRPLRYAFSIDDGEPTEVQPVPRSALGSDPDGWADSAVTGGWNVSTPINGSLEPGAHSLNLWLLEPGVVVQKVAIDLGGMRQNGLGPPESFKLEGL